MQFPRWMTWLFVGFLGYMLYLGNFAPRDVATPEAPAPAQQEAQKSYPKLESLTSFSTWKRTVNPSAPTGLDITDTKEGTGMAAGCGSNVSITLRGTTPDGANFDAKHDEKTPLTFTVGNAPYPVLNDAMLGMKPGGVRHVRSPRERIFPDQPTTIEAVLLNITLLSSSEATPTKDSLPLTIVPIAESTGGTPAGCGERVHLKLSRVSADGAIKPIRTGTFTLGKSGLGRAVDYAAQGMGLGEKRLILAPRAQKSPAFADGAILIERLKD